eukprot:CAMPEP_0168393440 /NCGR_PEP_ID=MMETSP0228-20121227/19019_1 /TAXON_ID=133427 /ORGANISM="Protoceratium reticulatum, Strain CCCM 535 (=CCMP 1889)" /LENGTH=511 /DNA_ID=CAMNT_0008406821 /DNA_START=53 /DNA_END=1584 /DNA_ORIENTATION=-
MEVDGDGSMDVEVGVDAEVGNHGATDAGTVDDDDVQIASPEEPAGKADIRNLLVSGGGGGPADDALPPAGMRGVLAAEHANNSDGVLGAFNLCVSALQEATEKGLAAAAQSDNMECQRLEKAVFVEPVALDDIGDAVALLVASAPLLSSGQAIFGQLPPQWLDVSGRSDALGTRCLFASRRHEHSVFAPVAPGRLLRVPSAAQDWQPSLSVPAGVSDDARLAEEQPWAVQAHPGRGDVRVLVRPGVLLAQMLRRGTALPAARFSWRVLDAASEAGKASAHTKSGRPPSVMLGEFSILSNVEDAAHTQPPHFLEFPLRREQLRSLGWMVSQEQRRREPFVTELRETVPCPDAPHWRLEGRLHCEYAGVKGGVLADAIGYGKTACTIGLVDSTPNNLPPQVPQPFTGFLPTRATLILAPTNLHTQWLGEITKFTGSSLKVLSVPTCTQLKYLTVQDVMQADIVVATYRLFYSSPYLHRLQELARTQKPAFAFPRLPGRVSVGDRGRQRLAAKL